MSIEFGRYPEFSLSNTKITAEEWCPRSYAVATYLSHGGWCRDAPAHAQTAYRLKQLSSVPLKLGSITHELARDFAVAALNGRDLPTYSEVVHTLTTDLRAACEHRDFDLFYRKPKQHPLLREVFYDGFVAEGALERAFQKIPIISRRLCEDLLWAEVACYAGNELVQVEELDHFFFAEADGAEPVKVCVKLDLFLPDSENGKVLIVDHKTSERVEGWQNQMALYALFALDRLGWDHNRDSFEIELRVKSFVTGAEESLFVTSELIEEAERRLRDGIGRLRSYQRDVETNQPVPLGQFMYAGNAQRSFCLNLCPYLDLCRHLFQ